MKRPLRLVRSTLASGAATLADQGVLFALVVLMGVPARAASVPALFTAGVVNFVANRAFAFRDRGGSLASQAPRFALVQGVSIVLNAVLFDLGMRVFVGHADTYWVLRLIVNSVVYFAWSFPMFTRVFRGNAEPLRGSAVRVEYALSSRAKVLTECAK